MPIVYIIDNNQYAYSTPNRLSFATTHLADRGPAYGFEGIVVDGTDVLTVFRDATADDAVWNRLWHVFETEIHMIKGRLEVGFR